MTSVGHNTKILIASGMSAIAYFSAGVAFYYCYKKFLQRNSKSAAKNEGQKRKRKRSANRSRSNSNATDGREKNELDSGGISLLNETSSCSDCACSSSEIKEFKESIFTVPSAETLLQKENSHQESNALISVRSNSTSQIDAETVQNEGILLTKEQNENDNVSVRQGDKWINEDIEAIQSMLQTSADVEPSSKMDIVLNERRISCDGEVSDVMCNNTAIDYGSVDVQSPSVSCDGRSEASQDSGKGTSTGVMSGISPVTEIELPPMYEFEIPQDIVGLIIGRKGTTIKYFTEESGAHIVIRHHYYSNKHKICTIEGTREQINKCLRLIRHKFPPSRFPELKLTPLLPPAIISPHSPVLESTINLCLPEGVKCEVVVSSMISAGQFFVQQPTHPSFPSLARLDQYMLAVYSQPAGVPTLPRPVDMGIICAAPVLAGWYRAQTIAMFDDTDEVLVKFVDYGGYSRLSAMDLRQIRSDFMNLPFQAVECCLADVKPAKDEDWSSEANEFFQNTIHGRLAETSLVGKEADTGVSLVELCIQTGKEEVQCINELLVELGYAEWCNENSKKLPSDLVATQ